MHAESEFTPPASDPLYLTLEEAAGLVGIDVKTLGRWTREDATLPVFRRGRVVRLHRARFLAWLDRQLPRRGASKAQQAA